MCVAMKQPKIWCILPINSQFNWCTLAFGQHCTYVSVMASNWITIHQTSNDFSSTFQQTNNVFLSQQISINHHKTALIQKICVANKHHKIWFILPINSQFNWCTSAFGQQCTYVSLMASNWITMHQTSNDWSSTFQRTNNIFLSQQISISWISAKRTGSLNQEHCN